MLLPSLLAPGGGVSAAVAADCHDAHGVGAGGAAAAGAAAGRKSMLDIATATPGAGGGAAACAGRWLCKTRCRGCFWTWSRCAGCGVCRRCAARPSHGGSASAGCSATTSHDCGVAPRRPCIGNMLQLLLWLAAHASLPRGRTPRLFAGAHASATAATWLLSVDIMALPTREPKQVRSMPGSGHVAICRSSRVWATIAVPWSVSMLRREGARLLFRAALFVASNELRPWRSSAWTRSSESTGFSEKLSFCTAEERQEEEPLHTGLARRPALTWPFAERKERITARGGRAQGALVVLLDRCEVLAGMGGGSRCAPAQAGEGGRYLLWLLRVDRVVGRALAWVWMGSACSFTDSWRTQTTPGGCSAGGFAEHAERPWLSVRRR